MRQENVTHRLTSICCADVVEVAVPHSSTPERQRAFAGRAVAWRRGLLCLICLLLSPPGQAGATEERTIVFAGDHSYPPYEYLEDGRALGASADLVKAIGEVLGRPVELRLMKWSEAQESVLEGRSDVLTVFGKSEEGEKLYDFSEPTFIQSFSLFVPLDALGRFDIQRLSGRRLGVTQGGWPRLYLEANHPGARLVVIDTYEDGFRRLLRGDLDAVIANTWSGYFTLRRMAISSIGTTLEPLKIVVAHMAVQKGNRELLTQIDKALALLKTTGEFDKIIDKWSGRQIVIVERRQVWTLFGGAAIALVVLVSLTLLLYVSRSKRIALAREVAERKRADQAVRESEAHLAASQQMGHLGNWEWNAATDEEVWSDETYRIFGLDPNSPCPSFEQFLEMVHPDDRDAVAKSVEGAITERRPYAFEYRVIRPDGTCVTCFSKAELILDDAGDVAGMAGILQDITERREIEKQLQRTQRLEAVGQLTGGVAHDFNNLLTVILGNLQLLERSVGADERLRKRVKTATGAAVRGAELTKRLLAFSRRQVLKPKLVDLGELVFGMEDSLRETLGEAIDFDAQTADGLWSTRVDPGLLEAAVLNLVSNASDAMPEGGKLTIETANVGLDEQLADRNAEMMDGEYVMLAVSDTGPGMPPDVAAQAFEPFFTTKDVGKGSGLGLSMVYGFIKQSGGHVAMASEEGHGTTVKLYLPRAKPSEQAVADGLGHDESIPSREEKTILVVEDDANVRDIAVTMLEESGYRVLEAENGTAALAVVEQHPDIDLLFTDVVMPGEMSGPALARRVRERHPRIKALYASGYPREAIGDSEVLDDEVELIGKPYLEEDLVRTIRRVLDG